MAVRDRNLFAWQAYVITASILSVMLLVGTYFLYRAWSDASQRLADQKQQLDTAKQEFVTSTERVDRLLSMLGKGNATQAEKESMAAKFASDEILGDVEKEFAAAMKNFAPNDPASEKDLLKLPSYLLQVIRQRNEQVDEARLREKDLLKQLTDVRQSETKAREDAVVARDKAQRDLEAARDAHAAAIAKITAEKEETIKRFEKFQADYNAKLNQLAAANQKLTEANKIQAETIVTQSEIINQFRNPDFAAPQGEIGRVADGGRTVWIDLGSADGLRVGVPFSVIDESAINISEADPKARLVITDVIGDHLSVGKVQSPDYRRPVITGDKVYSPAWRPGRTVGFALVGKMDINDDRKDDIDQVRELIRLAGGQVDAEIDIKGNRTDGPAGMTPNTSFLVLGTDLKPNVNASPELLAEQAKKAELYAKFIREAESKGIQQISLDKLMGYLKTDNANRTIPLGNRIRASDFPIESSVSPPVSRGTVSEIFTPRNPR